LLSFNENTQNEISLEKEYESYVNSLEINNNESFQIENLKIFYNFRLLFDKKQINILKNGYITKDGDYSELSLKSKSDLFSLLDKSMVNLSAKYEESLKNNNTYFQFTKRIIDNKTKIIKLFQNDLLVSGIENLNTTNNKLEFSYINHIIIFINEFDKKLNSLIYKSNKLKERNGLFHEIKDVNTNNYFEYF